MSSLSPAPQASLAPPLRVLFFLEPFPVRGRPADYQWIFDRWNAIAGGLEALGVATSFLTSETLCDANSGKAARLRCPRDFGHSFAAPLEPAALDAAWVSLMTHPDDPTWRPLVEAALDWAKPDVVVAWVMNAPLKALCDARGIVLMFQEAGLVRAPDPLLYYCDPHGVNGCSAVQEAFAAFRDRALDLAEEHALDLALGELLAPVPPSVPEVERLLELAPGRKVLGVFLQVARDSNLLAWPRIAGNLALARLAVQVHDASTWQVVVKPHPNDPDVLPALRELGCTIAPPSLPSRSLLEACDAVFTINSCVGFEALARAKPTFTFGASTYAGVGCTFDSDGEPEALRAALRALPRQEPPEQLALRRRLLHFLLFRYLVTDAEMKDAAAFVVRALRWRALKQHGAPLWQYFEGPCDAAMLRDVRQHRELALTARGWARQVDDQRGERVRAEQLAEALKQQAGHLGRSLEAAHGTIEATRHQLAAAEAARAREMAHADTASRERAAAVEELARARATIDEQASRLSRLEAERDQLAVRVARFGTEVGTRVTTTVKRATSLLRDRVRARLRTP